jgi:hypothetical protein
MKAFNIYQKNMGMKRLRVASHDFLIYYDQHQQSLESSSN